MKTTQTNNLTTHGNDEEEKEIVFSKALSLLEKGKTVASILMTYPQYTRELMELFSTIAAFEVSQKVIPSEKLLRAILPQLV